MAASLVYVEPTTQREAVVTPRRPQSGPAVARRVGHGRRPDPVYELHDQRLATTSRRRLGHDVKVERVPEPCTDDVDSEPRDDPYLPVFESQLADVPAGPPPAVRPAPQSCLVLVVAGGDSVYVEYVIPGLEST